MAKKRNNTEELLPDEPPFTELTEEQVVYAHALSQSGKRAAAVESVPVAEQPAKSNVSELPSEPPFTELNEEQRTYAFALSKPAQAEPVAESEPAVEQPAVEQPVLSSLSAPPSEPPSLQEDEQASRVPPEPIVEVITPEPAARNESFYGFSQLPDEPPVSESEAPAVLESKQQVAPVEPPRLQEAELMVPQPPISEVEASTQVTARPTQESIVIPSSAPAKVELNRLAETCYQMVKQLVADHVGQVALGPNDTLASVERSLTSKVCALLGQSVLKESQPTVNGQPVIIESPHITLEVKVSQPEQRASVRKVLTINRNIDGSLAGATITEEKMPEPRRNRLVDQLTR